MRAIITPVGLAPITVELESDPTWVDKEVGGWGELSFTATLDEYTRSRLYDAEVELVAGESCYFGFIRKWEGDSITAQGWWEKLADIEPREVLYSDDSLQPWQERTHEQRNMKLGCQVDGSVLRVTMEDGVALGTKSNGFWRTIPTTSSCKVTFGWRRPSTEVRLRLLRGTYAPAEADGQEVTTWTAAWTQANGSGSLTGTASVTISAEHDSLGLFVDAPAGYSPGSDTSAYFSAVKVYGLGTDSVTPDYVIGDLATNLPAYLKTGGTDISCDNTSLLVPFVFGDDTTPNVIGERVLDYTDAQLRFEKRLSGGIYRPALVFRDRPTTPSYIFDAHKVEAKLTGGDTSQLYTHVRVLYTDARGIPCYVDIEDTDATHPLVKQWKQGTWLRERWATITADTTSSTAATTVGQTFLALYGAEQVRGTVTVRQSVSGVSPALIEAGRVATLTNTEHGTVNVRIREVSHTGDTEAVCLLDTTPSLDDLLAELGKSTAQGRFNVVQFVDRRSGR